MTITIATTLGELRDQLAEYRQCELAANFRDRPTPPGMAAEMALIEARIIELTGEMA